MSGAKKRKKPSRRDTRRRVEQLAKNPLCEANALSAVHDVPMHEVAAKLGLPTKFGQSVFAITRGNMFERTLFADDAIVLREALGRAGVLPGVEAELVDLRIRLSGGKLKTLDESHTRTVEVLERCATRSLEEPLIIAGPTLEVPGRAILPDGMVALDLLVLLPMDDGVLARVGEVKIYPDRGGHTDGAQLATARAQAGLYLHLLRVLLEKRGWSDSIAASHEGFLLLSRAGQNTPSVRAPEDLMWQARRAGVAVDRLIELAAASMPPKMRLTIIADAPKSYCEGCVSFCDLANRCHDEALAAGEPVVLGSEAARVLGAVSIPRALELLSGAPPANSTETDLAHRLGVA